MNVFSRDEVARVAVYALEGSEGLEEGDLAECCAAGLADLLDLGRLQKETRDDSFRVQGEHQFGMFNYIAGD